MEKDQKMKKSEYPKPISIITLVFWTGLFGGIFWSLMGYLSYMFNFTEIAPNVILEPWAVGYWRKEWQGTVISIIVIGIFSVGAAFLYYAVLKKFNGIWPGIGYGIVIFLLVFFVLNPLFPSIGPVNELSRDTVITTICLYILYGLFIGYSISYDYNGHKLSEKEAAT